MVCFVHDRHYLSKFHGVINQLRQTNEFAVLTLQQLPRRCCSCPEKGNASPSSARPLLRSVDMDALRLVCLQMDLQRYVDNHSVSFSEKNLQYTVLPLTGFYQENLMTEISNQFTAEQHHALQLLQTMHHVELQFVTQNTSNTVLNEIVHLKHDLVSECATYPEALVAINGLWTIITADDQSRVESVKHALQKQWIRFLKTYEMPYSNMVYKWRENLYPKVTANTSSKRAKKTYPKQSKKTHSWHPKVTRQNLVRQTSKGYESEMDVQWSIEETLPLNHPQLSFLLNRFQNSNKNRRPRTHRRQHLLALAMVA